MLTITWTRARRRLLPLALLASLFLASVGPLGAPLVVGAATPHRAAVIVDTGAGVHRVVITFTEDSITGIDALQRAKADPVIYSFNGQGGAICRAFGVGRDAGPSCLGGQDGDNRYWAYFKAPAGTSSFTYSNVGAGTSKVHDGDVEGWKFGTGTAPDFVSLQSLAPPETPNPTTAPAAPVAPGATSGPNQQGPAGRGSQGLADATTSVSTLPTTGDTKAGAAAGSTGSAGAADASTLNESQASGEQAAPKQAAGKDTSEAALASASSDDTSSAASLIWFVVLLAVIVGAILVARRIRRRSANPAASTRR